MHHVDMANLTEFNVTEAVAVLTRTPATLNSLLRGLPSVWVHSNEGKDTWSAFDIMGHLVFGERSDWMPRVRILLEKGETRPFDPLDRFAQLNLNRENSLEPSAAPRRFRLSTPAQSSSADCTEFTAGKLEPTRKAPSLGSGNAIGTSGDLGRSRSHSSTSTFPRDGPPIS
jgi:hypothetical protein